MYLSLLMKSLILNKFLKKDCPQKKLLTAKQNLPITLPNTEGALHNNFISS